MANEKWGAVSYFFLPELAEMKQKKAFTLLELMIAIIVIGVLVSVALPRLLKLIEQSNSAEALVNLKALRTEMDKCLIIANNQACPCQTTVNGSSLCADLNNSPGAKFTYTVTNCGQDVNKYKYTLKAEYKKDTANNVYLQYNTTGTANDIKDCGTGLWVNLGVYSAGDCL